MMNKRSWHFPPSYLVCWRATCRWKACFSFKLAFIFVVAAAVQLRADSSSERVAATHTRCCILAKRGTLEIQTRCFSSTITSPFSIAGVFNPPSDTSKLGGNSLSPILTCCFTSTRVFHISYCTPLAKFLTCVCDIARILNISNCTILSKFIA